MFNGGVITCRKPNVASGGTISYLGPTYVHSFSISGTHAFASAYIMPPVSYLICGAGGAGGKRVGGGGGGGGVLTGTITISGAATYPVIVGVGPSGVYGNAGIAVQGTNGGNSSFAGLLAFGGGGGGAYDSFNGASGSSGGGGAGYSHVTPGSGVSGQGFRGGIGIVGSAAGGGGASAVGQDGQAADIGGAGGSGLFSSITGILLDYGSGGGGSANATGGAGGGPGAGAGSAGDSSPAPSGTARGGGGGGCRTISDLQGISGGGAPGVVIVRYVPIKT